MCSFSMNMLMLSPSMLRTADFPLISDSFSAYGSVCVYWSFAGLEFPAGKLAEMLALNLITFPIWKCTFVLAIELSQASSSYSANMSDVLAPALKHSRVVPDCSILAFYFQVMLKFYHIFWVGYELRL